MAAPATAQDRDPVPERRLSYADGVDLAGRDLAQIFDTTLPGCAAACLADAQCQAITFNARNNSCFPKADVTGSSSYSGAISGMVLRTDAMQRARSRGLDLAFLPADDLTAARDMARDMGLRYLTGFAAPEGVEAALREARATQDLARAQQLQGVLIVLTDAADRWTDFAALELAQDGDTRQARLAAINGYLRAPGAAAQAEALNVMSQALERSGDTRAMITALEQAVALSPRDDLAAALDAAQGKYGFRVTEHQVEADGAIPRFCAIFSENLARSGVDYASFVQLPKPGLSVEAEANQICVAGLDRGERYALTLRKGLPDAAGQVLPKDVTITAYIRDRAPMVSFPGRAYILPRGADAGVPVTTVNTKTVELRLLRVSDRNLVAAMRADYFATSLDTWDQDDFSERMATEVWRGTADVTSEINREVTTRLPVQQVTGPLGAGIYAMVANVPGQVGYDNPPAMQWFVVSDLGMTTYSGADGLTVAVRGLSDAAPIAGAQVALVSRANAVIAETQTDAQGVAHFAAALAAGAGNAAPALVSVTRGDDMSFLSLTDAEFDLSDRGVAGMPPAPPIDVFLTTDRGAYRAGETINATILARNAVAQGMSQVPLTVVLMRPDGVEYRRQIAPEAGAGGHVVSLPLLGNAPRGTWRLDVFADPQAAPLTSAKLLVEDFLPERIDFDLGLPEMVLSALTMPQLGITARYLFGAPGADLAIEGDVRLVAATDLPGFAGYRFGRHDEPFSPVSDSLPSDTTDAQGQAQLDVVLPAAAQTADRPLTAQVTVRLAEASGRPVERTVSRVVMPEHAVIGVRPLFDDTLAEGAQARFQLVALGADARPTPLAVHWRVNRIETHYQWYTMDGRWHWEPVTRRSRVAEGDVTLADAPHEIVAQTGWGEYELVVEANDPSSYAATSVNFEAGWFAPADVVASPDRLQMSLDQPAYRPGDTARLRINAAADGVALVSVLSNRVIALQSVAVTAGENQVDLPVTAEWGAGAYVTASVIRPLAQTADQAASRVPNRALGIGYAAVDPGARKLTASLQVPDASDPRAALPVTLRVAGVAAGETAWATIAAVDVGILNLTAFKAPDPQGHYFGQRRLGVGLRDLYGRLIDGQAGAVGALRSGGDASGVGAQAPPPTEELVAYFSGPLMVGPDGTVTTAFDMPSFNGTVRLMAVVWSDTGVGQASADVLVRDPVVISASVPRFLAPGDVSRLLLDLHHARGPAGQMGVDVTSVGLELGAHPDQVTLADQGRAMIEVPLTAGSEGVQTVRVALTTPDGKRLEKQLLVPVQANDPVVSRQSRFDLAAGKTFTLDADVFDGFRHGTARAILAAGPIARLDTPAVLAALDAYPYGCTEQITSKAMPLLYLSSVAQAMGLATPADLPARIDVAIAKVLTNQDASGAFGLWRAESGDGWLDAYVTDFLSRARKAGHAVPDQAFRSALDNLRNQVNYAADFDARSDTGALLAYQLMVLAREGAAAVGDLRYYADVKGDDFPTALAAAQLGAALASYGDPARADAMFARAGRMMSAQTADQQVWRADYGSPLRDRAAVLTLAHEAGSSAIDLDKLGGSVAAQLGRVSLSTQESVWVLMAASAMIDRPDAGGLTVNGQVPQGPVTSVIDADTAGKSLAIANTGTASQVLTLTTLGVPQVAPPASGNGWQITRSYYSTQGEPVDIAHVAQGTRLVAVLEITPLGRQAARLMVDDPLPAGFEIDNPNLIRGGDIDALDWLDVLSDTRMVEFRQDRFLAAVDWQSDQPFRLAYILRAVSPGRFHHPAASVADMYRPDMRAQTQTTEVSIE